MVLLMGWSPTTASVEMSTKRTGSVAVITVVTFSFTVSCSISGSLSWSSSSTKTTVIKQDGDNKVSNRDFSLGLNVGATIAFNYYF